MKTKQLKVCKQYSVNMGSRWAPNSFICDSDDADSVTIIKNAESVGLWHKLAINQTTNLIIKIMLLKYNTSPLQNSDK